MFIDDSYFKGSLEIAQLGQQAVVDRLNAFIAEWEPVILEAALGYDFYIAFKEGIEGVGSDETSEQRWLDLLNGKAFTTVYSMRKNYPGIKSALAGFIYYEYEKALHLQVTGSGVVKSKGENSQIANPAHKLAAAYNKAAGEMNIMWEFLQAKTRETPNVYPEYDPQQVNNINYWNWDYPFNILANNFMNSLF